MFDLVRLTSLEPSTPGETRHAGGAAGAPVTARPAGARPVRTGLAVVVVNFGSHLLLESNLAGLDLGPDVEVVVVDNFTDPGEQRAMARLARESGWHLVEQTNNDGFAAGANAGARRAADLGCSALLFLNPDALISAEVVTALYDQVSERPDVAVSPRIVTPGGRVEFRGSQVQLSSGRIRGIAPGVGEAGEATRIDGHAPSQLDGEVQGWLSGACFAISLELYRRTGGLDESYFLYWEDVDLSRRIEAAGGGLLVRQDLLVCHDEGGTHRAPEGRVRSDAYYYYNCRNRLVFAARQLSRGAILRWLLVTPRESWQILLRGGRRDLLASPRSLLAGVRGSLAGARIALGTVLRGRRPGTTGLRPLPAQVLVAHPGAELYGSDRMLLESVSGLIASGRQVTVVLPGTGPLVPALRELGAAVEFCRMPVLRKSALKPLGFLRLLADTVRGLRPAIRLIRRTAAGGLYVNTVTIPTWLVLGRLLHRPVVCHVHEAERSAPAIVRHVMALPALCAHRVIVNSNYSLDVLLQSVPRLRDRARVVYNGVVGPKQSTSARPVLDSPVRLLFVGRLSPRKGPDVALAALRELRRRGVDVHLDLLGSVFAGYEWFDDQLRADAATHDLQGHVRFLGFDSDVWPHLAEADIVLVPSVLDEPFGNTAVEALLAARPAVVSATSGLREAAEGYRAAVMVPPDDPTAMADAIETIVAQWPTFTALAAQDALRAGERHRPSRYHREITALVERAGRRS